MSVDAKLREYVEQALGVVDDQGTHGPRLLDDAERLWQRIQQFIKMRLVHEGLDSEALELACYAMQLPARKSKTPAAGRAMRSTLRDRAEEAAELLVSIAGPDVDESLLDRATRVLQEMPHRSPMLDEAKLLADAVNLEDFGVIGLLGRPRNGTVLQPGVPVSRTAHVVAAVGTWATPRPGGRVGIVCASNPITPKSSRLTASASSFASSSIGER